MSIFTKQAKKIVVLVVAVSTITLSSTTLLRAQSAQGGFDGGVGLLAQIAANTFNTVQKLDKLPEYIMSMTQFAVAWLTPDTSDTTVTLKSSFNKYTAESEQSNTILTKLQKPILDAYFGTPSSKPAPPNYANDLAYQSLLGIPVFNPDPRKQGEGESIDVAFNYLKNASGLNIKHTIPGANWNGNAEDQKAYYDYYTTTSAVQTYNAYVLGQMYADTQSGLSQAAATLIQQAAKDPDSWFVQVAHESIGFVLRQILMYTSQTYVLLFQIQQTQKQQLAVQAMTNTLLIAQGRAGEDIMLNKAIQKAPGAR